MTWYRIDDPENPPPKDGTKVLVCVPRACGATDVLIAWYCEDTKLWPADWTHTEEGEPCNVGLPTHWMPRPAPPEDEG